MHMVVTQYYVIFPFIFMVWQLFLKEKDGRRLGEEGGGWGKREEVGGRGRRLGEEGGGWGEREEVGGEGGGWGKREEVGGRGRRLGEEGGGTEEKEDREKDGKTEQTTITDGSV